MQTYRHDAWENIEALTPTYMYSNMYVFTKGFTVYYYQI